VDALGLSLMVAVWSVQLACAGPMCRCVQWRIVYLLSVAMSDDDDTCQSLIAAVSLVLNDCGLQVHKPSKDNFINEDDFLSHEEDVWNGIRSNARSK